VRRALVEAWAEGHCSAWVVRDSASMQISVRVLLEGPPRHGGATLCQQADGPVDSTPLEMI